MGEYLYGLRKLPKAQIHTVNGETVEVQYKLEFKTKSDAILRRLESKGKVQAFVIHGKRILKWDGRAYWFDYDKEPFTVVGEVWRDEDYRLAANIFNSPRCELDGHEGTTNCTYCGCTME